MNKLAEILKQEGLREASVPMRSLEQTPPGWSLLPKIYTPGDLRRMRITAPFPSGAVQLTGEASSKQEALRMAHAMVSDFKKRYWPGGMAEVVAVFQYLDPFRNDPEAYDPGDKPYEIYHGVVNTYNSGS